MNLYELKNRTPSRRTVFAGCLSLIIAAVILAAPRALIADQEVVAQPNQTNLAAIDVQIDKREVQVAERLQMKITATAPRGVAITFPKLENQLGDFEVSSVKDTFDIPAGPNRKWIRQIGLESLVSGEFEIPAIEISAVDRRGSAPIQVIQKTPSQKITIHSTLEGVEDPTQFRDIKSVVFAPDPQPHNRSWVVWAAGAAGLFFVAGAGFVLLRRGSSLSAKQWALKSLHELRESRALQDKDTEQIYIRLISILRLFVQEQFGILAPRLTTAEFLRAIKNDQRLSTEFRAQLQELLNSADLVKFAGMLPDSSGLTAVVVQAIQLVENAAELRSDSSTHSRKFQPPAEDN